MEGPKIVWGEARARTMEEKRAMLRGLVPEAMWEHFAQLTCIPRCSRDEASVRQHIVEVADRHGLKHQTDAIGNIVVCVPASPGREKAPTVVLQSHLDIVGEKTVGHVHNWATDPITCRLGDVVGAPAGTRYLGSVGTTLGADDGIGVAASLALMTHPGCAHGPVECLFTVEEEIGLFGAAALTPSFLEGRILINLDSEEDGIIYVGCAGGAIVRLRLPIVPRSSLIPFTDPESLYEITVSGLRGGHSGGDIHLGRANALALLGRVLSTLLAEGMPIHLVSASGGTKHNAIPRQATALVAIPKGAASAVIGEMNDLRVEYRSSDENGGEVGLSVECTVASKEGREAWDAKNHLAFNVAETCRIAHLLDALPCGVMSMSQALADTVETSATVAILEWGDNPSIVLSARSMVDSSLEGAVRKVCSIGEMAGCGVIVKDRYPGWRPERNSRLLALTSEAHKKALGSTAEVKAIHAGLECGQIGGAIPGMDMVSIGPLVENAHTDEERVRTDTVEGFCKHIDTLLDMLSS